MSYNTDLQNNNTSLQEILATVNSLPEAGGSSGGGAEIETCTMTIVTGVAAKYIYYLTLENGSIITKQSSQLTGTITLENVIVNSFISYCNSDKTISLQISSPCLLQSYENSFFIFNVPSGGATIPLRSNMAD